MSHIILENRHVCLKINENGMAESLFCKTTGQECLQAGEDIALFSVTQERPFNNEVKLAHPNKRITCQANRVRAEGDRLVVGFELAPYEAVIRVKITDSYLYFELDDFVVGEHDYRGLLITPPPVSELRLLQLPVKNRRYFGEWLNVSWDETTAVNVLGACPHARIDSERRKGYRVMTADAARGVKLKKTGAAIIVSRTDALLDCIDALERDFGLPLGVQSRRSSAMNRSAYWTNSINPDNIDEHIRYARQFGFTHMLIYITAFFQEDGGYSRNGDYDYRPEFPNGRADVEKILRRLKAEGITPGLHFLQTHIGLKSRYVTPVADHRLNKTAYFTLTKPLDERETTLYVSQNPEGAVMCDGCRLLQFGGELISYRSYTAQYPYAFRGCTRGAKGTTVVTHPAGEIGGILDVSEFGATSVYIDQNTDLQDEIADKIADVYNAGFEYVYFDGSEGAGVPFDFHVPNAQYRVFRKLTPPPLLCQGAAKAHFSWHFLSGGNAFDGFPPAVFKQMISRYPAEEAPRLRQDFTALDFGWWEFKPETTPDMYEFGTSRAAAWDCPVTMVENRALFRTHPRLDDIAEVMRRWEYARQNGLLRQADKERLRDQTKEHILLINEERQYELCEYTRMETAERELTAYLLERRGLRYVVYWHNTGSAELEIALEGQLLTELYDAGEPIGKSIPAAGRRYVKSAMTPEALEQAFARARFL